MDWVFIQIVFVGSFDSGYQLKEMGCSVAVLTHQQVNGIVRTNYASHVFARGIHGNFNVDVILF